MVRAISRPPSPARPPRVRLAVLLGLLLCAGGVGETVPPSGELRVGILRLPTTLDPSTAAAGPELMIFRLLFQGLVEMGDRGEIEPGLATQWAVSPDGLTWTFRLRSDARFHNGAPLTADDVVGSLAARIATDEAGEPLVPWSGLFHGPSRLVREVRRGEPGTVQILLGQPYSPLLGVLAHPALAVAVAQGDDEARFLGTGPYRRVEEGPGRLVLEAVPGGPSEPAAQRIVFTEVADDTAGVAGLAPAGTLDAYVMTTPPAWAGLGLQVLSAPSWQVGFLALRTDRGLLARRAVRQAIGLALDPALLQSALGRWGVPATSYLPPGAWAARDVPSPAFDLLRARRLLSQAGATEAAPTLLVPEAPSGPDASRLAEGIRLSLAAAGVKVTVRTEPSEAALQAMRRGETDLAVYETALLVNDPHFLFQPLVGSDAATPGSATNVAFFRSPTADGMLRRARQIGFRPERARLYQRLQAHLADEMPYVPLYVRLQWLLARPSVRGLRLDAGGRVRLDRARVDALPVIVPPPAAAPSSPGPRMVVPPVLAPPTPDVGR